VKSGEMLVGGGVNLKNIPSISEVFLIIVLLNKIYPYVGEQSSYFLFIAGMGSADRVA
jgi:hypothetical protein